MEKIKVLKKGPKIGHFPKGLVHGFCPKIEISRMGVSYRNYARKKSFLNILNRKQSFLDQKIEVLTRTKKWTFFKGVSPWILSKNRTFSYLPFLQKFKKKTTFLILWKEKNDFKWKKFKF